MPTTPVKQTPGQGFRPSRAGTASAGLGRTFVLMTTYLNQTPPRGNDGQMDAASWLNAPLPAVRREGFQSELHSPPGQHRRNCYLAVGAARLALTTSRRVPLQKVEAAVATVGKGLLQRTQISQVASFTYALVFCLPEGALLADAEASNAVADTPIGTRTALESMRLGLFIRNRDGAVWSLRVHPAYRVDAVADPWIAQLTDLDAQVGALIPGYAGAVIVTPRARTSGIHRDTASSHLLGECPTCPVAAPRFPGRS